MNKLGILILIFSFAIVVNTQCWKGSYGRGVGVPVSACEPQYEENGALCYPYCRDGYKGVGPVCWERCRDGYDDHGAICWRNAHIYGKGCCCFFGKCCNRCPSGYRDDGCTCRRDVTSYTKHSYGRGAGNTMKCKDDEQYDAGLCYKRCRDGYYGVGPVCWSRCPNAASKDCGAFCAKSQTECTEIGLAMGTAGIKILGTLGLTAWAPSPQSIMSFVSANMDLASKLMMDVCPSTPSFCWKKSENKAGSCPSGYSDTGKICYSRCSGSNPHDCGLMCANSATSCAKRTMILVMKGLDTANSVSSISNWDTKTKDFEQIKDLMDYQNNVNGLGEEFKSESC